MCAAATAGREGLMTASTEKEGRSAWAEGRGVRRDQAAPRYTVLRAVRRVAVPL